MGFIGVLIIIVCAVLILVVLVQNSKGGGLASNFSSSNQILGVAKTKDVLEQITWIAAGILFILCLFSTPKSAVSSVGDDQTATEQVGSVTQNKASGFAPTQKTAPAQPLPTK